MDYNKLTEALKNIRNGAFTRLVYTTELPVKSFYKNAGVRIVKETETTVRFGIKYTNIASVKERALNTSEAEKKAKTNNYKTVIANKLLYNTNTEKYYVCAFPTKKGTNAKCIYKLLVNDIVVISSINKELIIPLIIDSYWKKDFRETFRVDAEHIKKIGQVVVE